MIFVGFREIVPDAISLGIPCSGFQKEDLLIRTLAPRALLAASLTSGHSRYKHHNRGLAPLSECPF